MYLTKNLGGLRSGCDPDFLGPLRSPQLAWRDPVSPPLPPGVEKVRALALIEGALTFYGRKETRQTGPQEMDTTKRCGQGGQALVLVLLWSESQGKVDVNSQLLLKNGRNSWQAAGPVYV